VFLQVNDSASEASAVVNIEGRTRVFALARDIEIVMTAVAHEQGMKRARTIPVGRV
jgi:hypothetical protein